MAKTLQIVESAYRATLEEQDDTVLWITAAMKGAGAELDVLLRGSAVNYAVKSQDASGLSFGARKQSNPPNIAGDVEQLLAKGIELYVVEDDVAERGLERVDLISGIKPVSKAKLPELLEQYARVWHW
jgi:sulfur transfer complex TusBCD TusB component (DsrH family)